MRLRERLPAFVLILVLSWAMHHDQLETFNLISWSAEFFQSWCSSSFRKQAASDARIAGLLEIVTSAAVLIFKDGSTRIPYQFNQIFQHALHQNLLYSCEEMIQWYPWSPGRSQGLNRLLLTWWNHDNFEGERKIPELGGGQLLWFNSERY